MDFVSVKTQSLRVFPNLKEREPPLQQHNVVKIWWYIETLVHDDQSKFEGCTDFAHHPRIWGIAL